MSRIRGESGRPFFWRCRKNGGMETPNFLFLDGGIQTDGTKGDVLPALLRATHRCNKVGAQKKTRSSKPSLLCQFDSFFFPLTHHFVFPMHSTVETTTVYDESAQTTNSHLHSHRTRQDSLKDRDLRLVMDCRNVDNRQHLRRKLDFVGVSPAFKHTRHRLNTLHWSCLPGWTFPLRRFR